eukprot:1147865-Pelagomonas_calceolata.AAC.2
MSADAGRNQVQADVSGCRAQPSASRGVSRCRAQPVHEGVSASGLVAKSQSAIKCKWVSADAERNQVQVGVSAIALHTLRETRRSMSSAA